MQRHLGDLVSAYVDRRLPAAELLAGDRHVVVCEPCRHAVEQERRVLASLRAAREPGMSAGLQALLLELASTSAESEPLGSRAPFATGASLGAAAPLGTGAALGRRASMGGPLGASDGLGAVGARRSRRPSVPAIPVPARRAEPLRLPTVAPATPALHRSTRRAAMAAGLVAGASAAAAWGIGVAPASAGSVVLPTQLRPAASVVVGGASAPREVGSTGFTSVLFTRPAAAPRGPSAPSANIAGR